MSFDIRFGNFVLDGAALLEGRMPYRVTEHRFPRRPGSIAPRVPGKDSKRVNLSGTLVKDSEAQIKSYFEALGTKLDAGRDRLYIRDDNRYLNAVCEGFDWRFSSAQLPAQIATYNLQFIADDPFSYSPTQSEQTETIGAVNSYTFSVTNNGGVRTPPVFLLTRTSAANDLGTTKITHTTTGLYLMWTGTFINGGTLLFDCTNRLVRWLGGNGLPNFTGTIRMEMEPGVNNFLYEGPGNLTLVVAWNERWGLAA